MYNPDDKLTPKQQYDKYVVEWKEKGVDVLNFSCLQNENNKGENTMNFDEFIEQVKSERYIDVQEQLDIFFKKLADAPDILIELINADIEKRFLLKIGSSKYKDNARILFLSKCIMDANEYSATVETTDILRLIKYLNDPETLQGLQDKLKEYKIKDNCEK